MIKVTKELVIEQYKRTFIRRFVFPFVLMSVLILLLFLVFCVYLGAVVASHDVSASAMRFIIVSLLLVFLLAAGLASLVAKFKKTMKKEFYITTDKVVKRGSEKTTYHSIGSSYYIEFEEHGKYFVQKAYSAAKGEKVSVAEQLNEAYIGDKYYIAILNGTNTIIGAYNSNKYSCESINKEVL